MSITFIAVVALTAFIAWIASWFITRLALRQAQDNAQALRQDMQTLLSSQSQAVASQFSAQIGQLSQTVTTQFGQVLQQVQTGMASAGNMASDAQRAVSEQLRATTDMLGSIRQQLGQVQQAGHELSDAARQIENVLGAAKTRGILGEVALEGLLCDCLPPSGYSMQYRFSSGEAVDAVVRSRDKLLPIDSKFPLEDYRRLIDSGEEARSGFSQAVRKHADSIAKKYILPGEDTLDVALMFVPSEGVYYEILHSEDGKGAALDQYCRTRRVIPVSPSMLFALLQVILMGLRGMQVEENARRLQMSLAGLEKQMETFGGIYEKIGTHLRNAQQCYTDADRKLQRARDTLAEMAQGTTAELPQGVATGKALEPVLPYD